MNKKPALVQNAADQGQVKAAEEKLQFGREQELNDVRWVLSTPAGRRFYWRYLGETGLFEAIFGGGNDATNFGLGERNIGLKLMNDLTEAEPTAYIKMLQEEADKQARLKDRSGNKNDDTK